MSPWPRPFLKKYFGGHVRIVPEKMCVKFVVSSFNYLKLLAFNPQFLGVMWPWPRHLFEKIFWGHVRIVPKNICTKLEDWNFNRFEAIVCFRLYTPDLDLGRNWPISQKLAELLILSFYLVYLDTPTMHSTIQPRSEEVFIWFGHNQQFELLYSES